MPNIEQTPGQYLAACRLRAQLSQQDLALSLTPQISTQAVSHLERDVIKISTYRFLALWDVLKFNRTKMLDLMVVQYRINLARKIKDRLDTR